MSIRYAAHILRINPLDLRKIRRTCMEMLQDTGYELPQDLRDEYDMSEGKFLLYEHKLFCKRNRESGGLRKTLLSSRKTLRGLNRKLVDYHKSTKKLIETYQLYQNCRHKNSKEADAAKKSLGLAGAYFISQSHRLIDALRESDLDIPDKAINLIAEYEKLFEDVKLSKVDKELVAEFDLKDLVFPAAFNSTIAGNLKTIRHLIHERLVQVEVVYSQSLPSFEHTLTMEATHSESQKKVIVAFLKTGKFGKKMLKECRLYMHTRCVDEMIVVSQGGSTSFTKTAVTQTYGRRIRCFSHDDLLSNITRHKFVPRHRVLSTREKQLLLNTFGKHKWSLNELPLLRKEMPIARFLGLKSNDVVQIRKKSEHVGYYPIWRRVE